MTAAEWLAAGRALEADVIPGPWEADEHIGGDGYVVMGDGYRRAHLPTSDKMDDRSQAANAAFIAHVRTAYPATLDALDALLKLCDRADRGLKAGHPVVTTAVVRATIAAALGAGA